MDNGVGLTMEVGGSLGGGGLKGGNWGNCNSIDNKTLNMQIQVHKFKKRVNADIFF